MAIPNWLSLSQVSGSGDTVITITASTNEQLVERLGSLVISGHTKSVTVPVSQGYYDPMDEYLTFDILTSGNLYWHRLGSRSRATTIQYRINGGDWTSITSRTGYTNSSIAVQVGDVVEFKGTNATYDRTLTAGGRALDGSFYCGYTSGATPATFNVSGNIMSLVYGDNFQNQYDFTQPGVFGELFYIPYMTSASTGPVNAENLMLPATGLTDGCYGAMFASAPNLVKAPKSLPATAVPYRAYYNMFTFCTAMTTSPVISATSVGERGCYCMYNMCSSLASAQTTLPATSLGKMAYWGMYGGTSITTAPVLPATTLPDYAYWGMFGGCSALTSITCYATDISAVDCTSGWVNGVSATGTFTKPTSMASWTTGANGIPSGWTVVDI